MNLLDEVDAGFGPCDAVTRAGEVRAVDQKLILVGARTECRDRRDGRTGGRGGRNPFRRPMKSNMLALARRVGLARRSSGPNRAPNPGSRASPREPAPSTTSDSASPANFKTIVLSCVAPAPMRRPFSCTVANPGIVTWKYVIAGRESGKPQLTSLVSDDRRRSANQAGDVRRTTAPAITPSWTSLMVPIRGAASSPGRERCTERQQRPTVERNRNR